MSSEAQQARRARSSRAAQPPGCDAPLPSRPERIEFVDDRLGVAVIFGRLHGAVVAEAGAEDDDADHEGLARW
jgi:hypothetical protein